MVNLKDGKLTLGLKNRYNDCFKHKIIPRKQVREPIIHDRFADLD